MVGVVLFAFGCVTLTLAAQRSEHAINALYLLPCLLVLGASLNMIVVPLISLTHADVPPDAAGDASGVWSTSQQFGGARGIAVSGSIFFPILTSTGHTTAFTTSTLVIAGFFLACALLCLALPKLDPNAGALTG